MTIFAYARVSSRDQNLERQTDEFLKFVVKTENIFTDKKSGKDFDRMAYIALIKDMRQGDLLVIKSIDRLGRNYTQIIKEWDKITNKIGADIVVLDMTLLDTRTRADTLVGKFISDVVLQVLSFVAENERVNIKVRQKEGIALAKAKGIKFGRPQFIYSKTCKKIFAEYRKKEITLKESLSKLKMKNSTFFYHLKQYEKNEK